MLPIAALTALVVVSSVNAVTLQVGGSGNATSPLQYGVMFEDINNSGDGGIYAELIANRAFQAVDASSATLEPWKAIDGSTLTLKTNDPMPLSSTLPFSMTVSGNGADGSMGSSAGFENPGYWGIEVKPQTYTGSFYVRGAYSGNFTAALKNDISQDVLVSTDITSQSVDNAWTQHNFTLTPATAASNTNNSLSITFDGSTSLDFNFISLFPPTYNNRQNGLRVDLMEKLAELNPSFLRFPGGNNLEGYYPYQFRWNDTVGPLIERQGFPGAWGYYNTNGLGLVEYLEWCIDLNIEPILAVWAGFWLNGPSVAEADLGYYVQDALNELEYVMGDSNTTYGALRASHGYPDPWKLNYVEIGNEDNHGGGSDSYSQYRFKAFYDAIHSNYPNMTIIASTSDMALPDTAMGDYHVYTRPDDMVAAFGQFDANTSTHKTFIGEYAIVQPNEQGKSGADFNEPLSSFPFWIGSVAEAIYLLGAERNADAILGAAYAPTLQNLNRGQWSPDLISFDADSSHDVLSTSFSMIKLLSQTRITQTLVADTTDDFGPAYWVAGINENTNQYIVKAAVYNATEDVPFSVTFDGLECGVEANLTILTTADPYSFSYLGTDPVQTTVTTLQADESGTFDFELPALSIAVLETEIM